MRLKSLSRILGIRQKSQVGVVLIIRASHPSWTRGRLSGPPLRLRFVNLNLTPRIFLRVLRFSSLYKIDSQLITIGCDYGGLVGAVVRSLPSNHKVPGSNPGSAEC